MGTREDTDKLRSLRLSVLPASARRIYVLIPLSAQHMHGLRKMLPDRQGIGRAHVGGHRVDAVSGPTAAEDVMGMFI